MTWIDSDPSHRDLMPLVVGLMCGQPGPCGALRGGDFSRRHGGRDLLPQLGRILIAFHGRKVEPLVRGNKIRGHIGADGIFDAELIETVRCRGRLPQHRQFKAGHFKTSHRNPLSRVRFSPADFACVPSGFCPQARTLARKFESRFKYRDESSVNVRGVAARRA